MKSKYALLILLSLAASANAALIVSEDFGGLVSSDLNGTTADTFASAITTAGGSSSWVAHTSFKANGSSSSNRKAAYINLGSYINDAKGTATGIFTLQATVALPTTSPTNITSWFSLGFSNSSSHSITNAFNGGIVTGDPAGTATGVGTMIYRENGDIDQYAGVSTANQVAANDVFFTGLRTLTITLDLSSAFYNGTSTFGRVTFGANTGVADAYQEYGTYDYTSATNFNSILLSTSHTDAAATNTVTSTYSNLTLTQIPEPGSALLGSLGLLALLRRRR